MKRLAVPLLMLTTLLLGAFTTGCQMLGAGGQAGGPLIFLSDQFTPVEESEKMRSIILKDAPAKVDFIPEDPGPFNDRLTAEQKTNKVTVSVIGGLHGDFAPLVQAGQVEDLSALASKLNDRGFPPTFSELSRFGTKDKTYYVPWMQATYVLAVNKKALPYLPQGADVNALTYKQIAEWGVNIQKATNQRKIGFPGGPKGLIHRFFQGYLYPSYTGSSGVVGFKSAEAVTMWQDFKSIWEVSNPQSANYEFMQEPCGFMPVIAGFAIPKGAPNRAGAEQLIEYLTQPNQQVATLRELAFFPATNAQIPTDLSAGVRLEADAVAKQATAKDAIPSLLPIGLGAKGGELNKVYLDTFSRIILKSEAIQPVLDDEAKILQSILDDTKAGCWPPDPPSDGPCKVK